MENKGACHDSELGSLTHPLGGAVFNAVSTSGSCGLFDVLRDKSFRARLLLAARIVTTIEQFELELESTEETVA